MTAPIDNLGSRQRALNIRVNNTVASQVQFDRVRGEPEANDIDKLYKIDVAAKYKNVDYIIDTLKSGDSLYTSRALKKCPWLFEDECTHVINPLYLQNNVFPCTSMKMKRKIIKAAAARVKNPERAAEMFNYCLKEKMTGTALTCLLYTSDDFKVDQLRNNEDSLKKLAKKDRTYLRLYVGKSFVVLNGLLGFLTSNVKEIALQFSYLFFESEELYLDIAERYLMRQGYNYRLMFNGKISDRIMKKHKQRVLAKPKFYINIVNTDILKRNSTIEDIKSYVSTLLPNTVNEFWHKDYIYSKTYPEFRIFEMIPHEETFDFFKNYFNEHDPNTNFEMHIGFYEEKYYKFLTDDQREDWAFRHLESGKEILGVGRDFLFYEFINFNKAFEEIKKLLRITKDANIRNEMAEVLVYTTKNNRELEELLQFYIKEHVHESVKQRDMFLTRVVFEKNVLEFDEGTWTAFYALIVAMDHFDTTNKNELCYKHMSNEIHYKSDALLYHLVYGKEIDEIMLTFLRDKCKVKYFSMLLEKVTNEKKKEVSDYFLNFYMNLIDESKYEKFKSNPFHYEQDPKWKRYFKNINKALQMLNDRQIDIKEERLVPQNTKEKRKRNEINQENYVVNEKALLCDLKKDKEIVISKLTLDQFEFNAYPNKTNVFLSKIKIYFPEDITKIYLNMFQGLFTHEKLNVKRHDAANALKTGVHVIFQLADEKGKRDFLQSFWPTVVPSQEFTSFLYEPSDDEKETSTRKKKKKKKHFFLEQTKKHSNISLTLLDINHRRIRRAVCLHACFSRPAVEPLALIAYMKGGSGKYCLHLSNIYLAVLPFPMCVTIVHSLIDAPAPIQEQAIRLAVQYFDPTNLKEVILKIWDNTVNVSVRNIIYNVLYNKVVDTGERELYAVLKTLTTDLNQNDKESIFEKMTPKTKKLPQDYVSDYITTVWVAVNKFKDEEQNITRKKNVINEIICHMHLLNEDFVLSVVDEHLKTMMNENKLHLTYSKTPIAELYKKKWLLAAHFVLYFASFDDYREKYIKVTENIIKNFLQGWNQMEYGIHVYQQCYWDFFNNLKKINFPNRDTDNTIPIFESILNIIDKNLKYYDSYLLVWELHLVILTKNIIKSYRNDCKKKNKLEMIHELIEEFGKGVGKLVLDRVQNNEFALSFTEKVVEYVNSYIEKLVKFVHKEFNDTNCKWNEHFDKALITASVALAEFELVETYVFAIQLLPTDCKDYANNEKFKNLLDTFERLSNADVLVSLHQKFQKYCNL